MKAVKETEYFADLAGHKIDITITQPSGKPKDTALFLHGAGESTKERCLPLARLLSRYGWRCVTFSAPGHGNSSGKLLGSSLAERLKVSLAVAKQAKVPKGSELIGVSMGAHTAIHLTGLLPDYFPRLVLMVPAIYSQTAEEVPFGPKFSEILHIPKSYYDSKSWQILDQYPGHLAVIRTGQDDVIPADIYDLIDKNASRVQSKQTVLIPDSPHRINIWLQENPKVQAAIAKALDSFDFSAI